MQRSFDLDGSIGAISVKSNAWSVPRPAHVAAGDQRTEAVVIDRAGEPRARSSTSPGKPVPTVYLQMDILSDRCEAITGGVELRVRADRTEPRTLRAVLDLLVLVVSFAV